MADLDLILAPVGQPWNRAKLNGLQYHSERPKTAE